VRDEQAAGPGAQAAGALDGQRAAAVAGARDELVAYSVRMLDDGLAAGSSGNISVRLGDTVAITPSGISYRELQPADICLIGLDGAELDAPEKPSTEVPMHLTVYAATGAAAVVHTHSPEVIALSAACDELPAIHYAIAGLGGPVRVAPYHRFASAELAKAAVSALAGRSAAILQNHGAISCGRTLAEAFDRAVLLEWLAGVYRLARSHGTPRILTEAELAEVAAETRRRRYGERRQPPGAAR
jgi:L-fuculose-phosphate aldolase